ncbi:ribonuclease R [Candidatus Berkiella aquae]|uniref:Ribonuclease R n=1 Tax=Candidatus Berkiella aquae TaxID=295108 RepID=A0A0Q9YJ15_9GAMM|nr:ribonuclease R [Candidatus Berkiella aquae]MCS5710184.1 ribonuclease R [Candidatus Berkiella aquae]
MSKKESNQISQDPFEAREALKYETPIPSREFILAELTKWQGAVKRKALLEHFQLHEPDLREAFRRRLKAMVRDGQLMKTHEGYIPIADMEVCTGIIVMDKEWEGYLRTESDQTIALSGPTLRGYYDGDKVQVQIIQIDRIGNAKGRIIQLLEAVTPMVIGRLIKTEASFEVLPFERKITQNITIPKTNKHRAKDGDIVHVKILRDEKYQFHVQPVGEVVEVLGDLSTPGIEVNIALRKFNVPHEWPQAVLEECKKWENNEKITYHDEREDLTDLPLVTIDGEDAKDFDDAVFCEAREQGGWRLWVAIADVGYYVKPGSSLDKEAIKRGNSTYFPGSVVPMLPEILSNGWCSLKPQVPRLCVVCQMSINEKGIITRARFSRAIMNSKARLTYTEVAEMLRGNKTLRDKYAPLVPALESLHNLYEALYAARKQRGAIDFDTIETRILFDSMGKINSIVPQVRNVAHKMIEESMLAANVSAAKFIERHKVPNLYRIHDRPPHDKLVALRQFLAELGLGLPGGSQPSPKMFSELIASIQNREDRHVIETVMLRSLSQAQYSPENIGHFGLAYSSYSHFTSPIRRYPDLVIHRTITDILAHKNSKKSALTYSEIEKLGAHCSETERRSDEATRDASLALKCHYIQDKIGQTFRAIISGVASFGIFAELKDIYVEGLIHVTALGNEYFHYDPAHHRMIGERTRTVYRLGDAIEVRVVRVDIEAKKIDFELIDYPQKTKRTKDKSPPVHSKKKVNKPSQSKKRRRKKS